MRCTDCGGATRVIDVRSRRKGEIYRRRMCRACGFRFSSFEIIAESIADVRLATPPSSELGRKIALLIQEEEQRQQIAG